MSFKELSNKRNINPQKLSLGLRVGNKVHGFKWNAVKLSSEES